MFQQTTNANGTVLKEPQGDACHFCYEAWESSLKAEYTSWSDLIQAHESSKEVAEKINKVVAVHRGTREKDHSVEQVLETQGITVDIERHMIVLSDAEVRAALHVPRLLKSHTKDLRSIVMPSEGRPHETETLWCFSDPTRPYRTAKIRTSGGVSSEAFAMPSARSCYQGQARHYMNQAWASSESLVPSILSARLPTLHSFLRHDGANKKSSGAGSGADDGDSDGEGGTMGGAVETVGIAASAVPADKTTSSDGTSLVSPSKGARPPVRRRNRR